MTSYHFEADGVIKDGPNGQQMGYIKGNAIYSGGYHASGGQQVGYIKGDEIYAGGYGTSGGRQVGYIRDGMVYEGGYGTNGGRAVESTQTPHPRWNAAGYFLLT